MAKTAFEFRDVIRSVDKRGERFDPFRSITPAIIKEVDGAVFPPNQPTKVWVSEFGSDSSRVLAWNPNGIKVAETPVLVGRSPRPPFERVVLGINLAAMFQSPDDTQITLIDTGPHGQNHQIPSEDNPGLDPVYIFIYAMMPLKTISAGVDLTVSVQPYIYRVGPSVFTFPGQEIDLTTYLPASGNIKIVLLYLDEETNSIAVAEGAEVLDNGVIEVPYPDVPDEGRPSSFIALVGGQTIILQTSVEEARDLFPKGSQSIELTFPQPAEDGQVLYGEADGTWGWRTPITSEDGWLVDGDGILIVE